MPPRLKSGIFRTFVCPECQLRSFCRDQPLVRRSFSTSPRLDAASSARSKYLHLTNRSIIRLAGPDAALFLHNLIPAKILDIGGSTNPIYTAFLSAHGRILNDVFVYPPAPAAGDKPGEEWLIEVDSESAGDLLKHLKKHKLRAKFTLEKVDGQRMGVYYTWPPPTSGSQDFVSSSITGGLGGQDPRPGMGVRWLLDEVSSKAGVLQRLEDTGSQPATMEEYTVHRMLNGVAEGQSEIISGHALPQESNLDFFGGIDFFKGCYLGQELTIRTHHTGVVRKRILPCQLYDPDDAEPLPGGQELPEYRADMKMQLPPPGSNICKLKAKGRGRSSGKWLGGVGNIGLALCRLEMMTDIQLTADRTNYDPTEQYKVQWETAEGGEQQGVMLKPFVPRWLREGVEQSLRRKEKKAKPRREEEEEEEEVD
ncbi:uncharacterized protein Z520_00465 [Fonsecaea multimorphosa CBS 102226]|uniref:Iron-sulfur cluster assembly factor IBA57 homolog, mitochondrial n=1 Tax=Fonsecaea multimorphosa CBS 102226 TaxID=1442371 RepID=A0A0D2L3X8_9EURO|nr:uncharacterized protein Z520_00465 [Fonsecaea multimorphosa CBS 102226]KIY03774.1 hypothetical protein Z520_00465 [Fonsecaea multimorphosa CBS 102226]OAL32467.1 hypothetical protein AYO22_00489 [Fonsecaea multimorphosa]